MRAFLFLVNPLLAYDPYPDWARWMPQLASGVEVHTTWNTGTRRRGIDVGDLGVIVKVGERPKGLIGLATISREIWIGPHWNPEAKRPETGYVDLSVRTLLPLDDPFPLTELRLLAPGVQWTPRMSGTEIPVEVASELFSLLAEDAVVAKDTRG